MTLTKTRLVSVSKTVDDNNNLYFRNIAEKILLIPNGIDLKKYNKINFKNTSKKDFNFQEDALIISYVARLEEGKNHDFLIDLWPDVLSKFPNAILCFAGDGSLREYLYQKVKIEKLQNNIHFLGQINNVAKLLSITEIGVFPSSYEGFSLVMLEKLAMKLPVVASDIKPFQEIVTNDIHAFLVPIKEKKTYTEKIIQLCKDVSLRKEMGEKAYLAAKNFSLDSSINLHDQHYKNSLDKEC